MAKTERKVAVVLIHGIGDQKPMASLRGFVSALLADAQPNGGRPRYWSKPDAVSGSFDLRRFQAGPSNNRGARHPPIDFYEYYWAHRMEGNALSHSFQWLNNLLLRRPSQVPPSLRKLWFLCWVGLALVATVAAFMWRWEPVGTIGAALALIILLGKLIADWALRDWVGDAARYFSSYPRNIVVREAVRRGGVDLLQKLHETGDYNRIIVVGHSLGSAIALDVLYHYWTIARSVHAKPEMPSQSAVSALEAAIKSGRSIPILEMRGLQKEVWKELRANGVPWRITDLITLGSPLTHYPFLTGLDRASFENRLVQREIPTCPPVLDGKGISYWERYNTKLEERRSIGILHHAACFAATRWTNLYFPHDGWLAGDPVGGPLQGLFGLGIDDRVVKTRHWGGRLNHLDYWRADPRDTKLDSKPVEALRAVIDLDEGFGPNRRKAAP